MVWFSGEPVWSQEWHFMILAAPFQLRTLYDSMIHTNGPHFSSTFVRPTVLKSPKLN